MLKVSNTSWHYRLRAKTFSSEPKDLCSYFWSTVASAMAIVLLAIGRLLAWLGRGLGRVLKPLGRLGPPLEWLIPRLLVIAMFGLALFMLGWLAYIAITQTIDFLIGLAVVIGGVLFVLALIAAAYGVHRHRQAHRSTKPKMETEAKVEKEPKPKSEGSSTLRMLWAFLVAKKKKACPLIEVIDERPPPAPPELKLVP